MSSIPGDPQNASRNRIRIATTLWFAALLGCLLAVDAISMMDPRAIAILIVLVTTLMFTCMQVIAREMGQARATERPGTRRFRQRSVPDLALRNLIVVASVYAILWMLGALPF